MTDTPLPIMTHIAELRKRLTSSVLASVLLMIPAYLFYSDLITFLARPFEKSGLISDPPLFITSIFEGFMIKIKFALLLGLIAAIPVHLYNLIRFIFPALNRKERTFIIIALISSIMLSLGSFYLIYFKLLPFSIDFLTSSEFIPDETGMLLSFKDNIFYVFNILIYGILLFQLPILLELLLYLNIIKRKSLWKASKFVIVGIFILSAVVTPPDVISQVSIALPLIALYFLTILIAKLCNFGAD